MTGCRLQFFFFFTKSVKLQQFVYSAKCIKLFLWLETDMLSIAMLIAAITCADHPNSWLVCVMNY
jgi:hypothetical protein